MKRIIAVLLAALVVFALGACKDKKDDNSSTPVQQVEAESEPATGTPDDPGAGAGWNADGATEPEPAGGTPDDPGAQAG
ncbi:hypothetical protein LJC56_00600 [Christensenellaceae bacterium OttesenSCG-928-K19]|nr:hypothetical protein [Christensenellaceae bacterium OttesenSCG-928-K19]